MELDHRHYGCDRVRSGFWFNGKFINFACINAIGGGELFTITSEYLNCDSNKLVFDSVGDSKEFLDEEFKKFVNHEYNYSPYCPPIKTGLEQLLDCSKK